MSKQTQVIYWNFRIYLASGGVPVNYVEKWDGQRRMNNG